MSELSQPDEAAVTRGDKLRVAMLSNLFFPVVSGSSTQVRGLARSLTKLGHHVIVITAHVDSSTPCHEVIDGFEVYRVPALHLPKMEISLNFPWLNWTFWPKNLRRMQEIIEKHQIGIIHVHNHMFDLAFAGRVLTRRLSLPLVLTMHTVIKHSNWFYDAVLRTIDRCILGPLVVSKSDRVICPDNNMTAYVRERFAHFETELVTYGVDEPDEIAPAEVQAISDRYGLNGCKVILSVGHVHAIRNRHEIIRALPAVIKQVPNVKLVVVGGVFDESPGKLAKELGVAEHIVFVGAQPRATISAFLAAADIEAHWLNQDEGTWASPGLASMEAMYAGLPVFTVASEGIYGEGVIENGRNIILIKREQIAPLETALVEILQDDARARRIGAAAAETCAQYFSWPRIAQQTADAYARELQPR